MSCSLLGNIAPNVVKNARFGVKSPHVQSYCQAADNAAVSADGGEKCEPLAKWAFRGVCPSSFVSLNTTAGIYGIIRMFD